MDQRPQDRFSRVRIEVVRNGIPDEGYDAVCALLFRYAGRFLMAAGPAFDGVVALPDTDIDRAPDVPLRSTGETREFAHFRNERCRSG